MHATKTLIIGASLTALVNLGTVAAAEAQTSTSTTTTTTTTKTTKTTKAKRKDAVVKKPTAQEEMASQLQVLHDQVEALQRRLDTQTATEQQTKATADQAVQQASAAKAQAATATAATQAIPAEVKTAVDAAKPKTDKIYVKGVSITLGGFVESASIYRQRDQDNDISSSYNSIPFNSVPIAHTNQFVETARQSRFSALVQGNPNPDTHLSLYTELDLQGAAQTANSRESNSYNPRLREMFGSIDWDDIGLHFLAGQAWSMVTLTKQGLTVNTEALPPTIDGQYMPGFTWARQPQVRLTKDFDKMVWLGLSLENPQTSYYSGPNALPADVHSTFTATGNGQGYNSLVTNSLNHLPDVIAKVAVDPLAGTLPLHIEAYGLYSNFYQRINYANQTTSGGGFGGGVFAQVVPKFLDFQVSGLAGKGIGRYGSGQLSEVTFDAGGNLQPIHEVIALAGFTLHAAPSLDLYLFAGQDRESAQSYDLTSATGVVTPYGLGNALYSNTGCLSETAVGGCVGNERYVEQATAGFWNKPYIGSFGMIRWGIQYAHTEFKTFEGKGGAPTAIQNSVLVSFRYYPFTDK